MLPAPRVGRKADPGQPTARAVSHSRPRTLQLQRALAFGVAFSLLTYLSLNGGGYDAVLRGRLAIALWALIGAGALAGAFPRARLGRLQWSTLGLLAALAGFTALSLVWSGSAERTYLELGRVLGLAGFVVLPVVALDRYTWRPAAAGVAAAIGTVTILALTSRLGGDLIAPSAVEASFDNDRLAYPFDYWNATASWAAMAIAVGLSYAAQARSWPVRCLGAALVPAAILTVYLTFSRGGAIAAAVAVVAVVAVSRGRWSAGALALATAALGGALILLARSDPALTEAAPQATNSTMILATLGAGALAALVAVGSRAAGLDRVRMELRTARISLAIVVVLGLGGGVLASEPLGGLVDEFKGGTIEQGSAGPTGEDRLSGVGSNRYEYWDKALDAFADNPINGLGPGTFEYYWAQNAEIPEYVRDAHSLYLEQLAELGLPGLLFTVGLLLALSIGCMLARRGKRSGLGAEQLALTAVFAVWVFHTGLDWFWEFAALTGAALAAGAIAMAARTDRIAGSGPWMLRAGLGLVALAVILVEVPALVSVERVRDAQEQRVRGNLAAAASLATEAIEATPWAATPYYARAEAYRDAGELKQAGVDVERAIEREPGNLFHPLLAAEIAIEDDRPQRARRALDDAIELNGELPILNQYSSLRQAYEGSIGIAASEGGPDG